MLRINQFYIEPGTYKFKHSDQIVVVSEIVTHEFKDSQQQERSEPLIVYRDLVQSVEKYVTYSMNKSDFQERFIKY